MNAIITRIFLFGENQEKREVPLYPGLNIITGDSKTGKSALLEIVDYCLFSTRSTIPKGEVENFSILYSIVLKASEKYIVIARHSAKTWKGNKAFVKVETSDQFLNAVSVEYFSDIEDKPIKEAQRIVENHLGLSVLDTRLDEEDDKQKEGGKATLRSFVSYLFQHQNLIANKHSIFYRFDDYYKRKKTIEDFPILIGWETSEYFLYWRELEQKNKELKIHNKLVKNLKLKNEELQSRLKSIIQSYYNVIGLELDTELSLSDLRKIAQKLPDVSNKVYADSNLKGKIQHNEVERENLRHQLNEILELLALLETNSTLTQNHAAQLRFLNMTSSLESSNDILVCPVCHSKNSGLSDEIHAIYHSKEELKSELAKIDVYTLSKSKSYGNSGIYLNGKLPKSLMKLMLLRR